MVLPLRTDIAYSGAGGKLTQAGVEAIQGQFNALSADATGLDTRLTAVEAELAGSLINLQTSVTASGQTSIDFTGIPSWVQRITVIFAGFSTNGTSIRQVQIGDGAFVTSGYTGGHAAIAAGAAAGVAITSGFALGLQNLAADTFNGTMTISRLTGNTWVASALGAGAAGNIVAVAGYSITLGGVLDRLRITTVIGSQTFDAGSVNISWE